jgi:hypothetical protein
MYRLTSPLGLIARPLFAALGLSLLAWAPAARGDLYQGFDRYPLGPGVEPGSLADPTGTLATSGNRLRSLDVTSYDAGPLETWGTPGTNVWVSWLQRRDQNRLGFQGFVVTAPLPGSTTTRYGVFFAGEPGSGPGDNTLVIGQAGNDLNVVSSGVPVVPNQTYFLVAHFQFRDGNDQATLFVNPTPGTAEPTGGVTYSDLDMPIVQPVVELIAAGNTGQGVVMELDELRIGGTYAAVAPVAPEPAGVVVIAAMAVLLVRGRRPG